MTVILGGGLSGLSAAYYVLKQPTIKNIVILEASSRLGGWVHTKQLADGTIFEQGPRTIKLRGNTSANTLNLLEELGLREQIIPITSESQAMQSAYIYAKSQLHAVPTKLKDFFKVSSLINGRLASLIVRDILAKRSKMEDECLYSNIERKYGKDLADYVISPLICGISAGDARQISVRFLFDRMFELEQKYGSAVLGGTAEMVKNCFRKTADNKDDWSALMVQSKVEKWMSLGLEGGMELLPRTLASKLDISRTCIETEHKCEKITFGSDHVELVVNGQSKKCSRLISSIAAKSLAPLLREQHPKLAEELGGIPMVTVPLVNLKYDKPILLNKIFGVLVAPKENLPILGISFDSCIVPQKSTVLTVMMGGAWFDKYFGKDSSEDYLSRVAVDHVKKILNITADPTAHSVSILRDCIPQHIVGHKQRLVRIREYISTHKLPLFLCGSSYEGVGMNDVILSAKSAVSGIS